MRPLVNGDISSLSAWLAATPELAAYGYDEVSAVRALERAVKGSDFVVIAQDKKAKLLCGFVWVQAGAAFGKSGYLRLMGVHPRFRHKGVGTALLAEAEMFVGGVSNDMFVLVPAEGAAAKAFFERRGYQVTGELSGYRLAEPELLYRKTLTEPL